MNLVPIKLLILIQSFVEEFEIGWRRYTNYIEPRAWRAVDVTNKLDESTSLFNPLFREKFIRKFTPMLVYYQSIYLCGISTAVFLID